MTSTDSKPVLGTKPALDQTIFDYMPDADFTIAFDHSTDLLKKPLATLVIETKINLPKELATQIQPQLEDMTEAGRAALYLALVNSPLGVLAVDGVGVVVLQAACGLIDRADDQALERATQRAGH
jgi:hypothetical protein